MRTLIARRAFVTRSFQAAALAAAASVADPLARAIEPIQRRGSPRLLLSLAAYSFRDFFAQPARRQSQAPKPDKQIDLFDFIDYCADHGCHGSELTSYYFRENVTTDYLLKLKRHAFLRGIEISGTAVGNTFTDPKGEKRAREIALVKRWVDYAQIMGAPHIRVFAGNAANNSPEAKAEAKRLCIEALEECGEYAGSKGVFLGIENHGGIVSEADELVDIVRTVKNPWIGVNLDTGNFRAEDPYAELAKCAPYAVNVQVKVEIQPAGQEKRKADLPRLIEILRKTNYQGYVALEYEAAEDPWQAVPPILNELGRLLKAATA